MLLKLALLKSRPGENIVITVHRGSNEYTRGATTKAKNCRVTSRWKSLGRVIKLSKSPPKNVDSSGTKARKEHDKTLRND